jgi:lipopolysaccharide export system protein LptA
MWRRQLHTLSYICLACVGVAPDGAYAGASDRTQPMKTVSRSIAASDGANQRSVLEGAVKITQGSLLATGDRAEVYTDADSVVIRVVITGRRAHIEQMGDDGVLTEADADAIDYSIANGRAVLTGSATTRKQGVGNSAAPKITYSVSDGTFFAEGSQAEAVRMTFLPKKTAAVQ